MGHATNHGGAVFYLCESSPEPASAAVDSGQCLKRRLTLGVVEIGYTMMDAAWHACWDWHGNTLLVASVWEMD
jgi:hypothetical protein